MKLCVASLVVIILLTNVGESRSFDYKAALTKSLLYFEGQRSGKLPRNQRVQWRGDSGLKDGSSTGVNLVGGYYDAGDNVKFGLPMAFTVTMLAWGVVDFGAHMKAKGELGHAIAAIKWGTDYLLKTHPYSSKHLLYGEVGDGDSDHRCWQRPEDMTTPRTVFTLDQAHPGSDLAAETAAALAAASIVFRRLNRYYAALLLRHSIQLFEFARTHQGVYTNSIEAARKFYPSSGFNDELLWAAAWLHRATGNKAYLDFLGGAGDVGGDTPAFSWDDKFLGAQILVAKLVLDRKVEDSGKWNEYKRYGEDFLCSCLGKGPNNFKVTPGGLLWFLPWANLQYVTAASFAAAVYADYLSSHGATIQCPAGRVYPSDLTNLAKRQIDYILGSNPKGMSYMVGFGSKYPTQAHHRAASIVSIKKDRTPVTCSGGFKQWFNRNAPNPNILDGAVVGGPDQGDAYTDSRANYAQAEPATATVAPIVGVLARLA